MKPKLREAVPVGHHRGPAFTMRARGCALEDVRTPIYTIGPEARALSTSRSSLGLGLRDAATKLGIRALEVSELERGRLVPEDPGEWPRLLEALSR